MLTMGDVHRGCGGLDSPLERPSPHHPLHSPAFSPLDYDTPKSLGRGGAPGVSPASQGGMSLHDMQRLLGGAAGGFYGANGPPGGSIFDARPTPQVSIRLSACILHI